MSPPITLPNFEFHQRLPGNFQLPARMSVLPLADGTLALVSPIPIDDVLAAQLAQLGSVTLLIAPNLLHHLYLGDASQRYPAARVLAPRELRTKRPDLRIDQALEDGVPAALSDAVSVLKIEGMPKLDEHVFVHHAQRALVITDLVFNVRSPRGFLANLVLFLVGCHGRLAQSRAVRMWIQDRKAYLRSMEQLFALPFDQLLPAHGELVLEGAHTQLRSALLGAGEPRALLPATR